MKPAATVLDATFLASMNSVGMGDATAIIELCSGEQHGYSNRAATHVDNLKDGSIR